MNWPVYIFISVLSLLIAKEDWGFYAHQKINRLAVFSLPPEMIPFYKTNIEFLTLHAVDPDKRRYAVRDEFARHYIDIDHWDTLPFNKVPRNLKDAILKYGNIYKIGSDDTIKLNLLGANEDSFYFNHIYASRYSVETDLDSEALTYFQTDLKEDEKLWFDNQLVRYGVLPYFLEDFYKRLVYAFSSGDENAILRISADLGHYISDAHVPLHTTVNYNGQLTGQLGLHAFWESRLPELFADEQYDFLVGRAEYIEDVGTRSWQIIMDSHELLPAVLEEEKKLQSSFPADRQFCFDERSGRTVRTQCEEFAEAYHIALSGMVEKRMQDAILSVASFWYSAWVDAGQPDLGGEIYDMASPLESEEAENLEKVYNTGTIYGRTHDR